MNKILNTQEMKEELKEKHRKELFLAGLIPVAILVVFFCVGALVYLGEQKREKAIVAKEITEDTYNYYFSFQNRDKVIESVIVKTHYEIETDEQIKEIEQKYGFKTAYFQLLRIDKPQNKKETKGEKKHEPRQN
jgi:NADH:ubiquinone oxidoreductase subunit 5 (subunit L)/multisubunit Na+/H+ antiporter MnhA subunit